MIDVFEGPRHDKLRRLWRAFARYRGFPLVMVPNPAQIRHDVFLSEVWRHLRRTPKQHRFLIITEADFLPDYVHFPLRDTAAAVEHAQRAPSGAIKFTGMPGAWYMVFDRTVINGSVDFRAPASPYHDPGNDLERFLLSTYGTPLVLIPQQDCWPTNWGLRFSAGTHLFWSRHLHDDPSMVVCGFSLGDIQRAHDAAVQAWLDGAPAELKEIVKEEN